jgi:hypothetical protein
VSSKRPVEVTINPNIDPSTLAAASVPYPERETSKPKEAGAAHSTSGEVAA